MVSKYETSTTTNDQMLKPDAEKSSSLDKGESTLSLQSKQSRTSTTSLHQSSNIGAEGCMEINGCDAEGKGTDYYTGTMGDAPSAQSGKWGQNFGPDMDPKKIKRLLANRVSAQKSREKKAEYIENLKKDVALNEAKVAVLAPSVSFYEMQRSVLEKENSAIKQRLKILAKGKAMKEAEYQALKDERDVLSLTRFLMQEGI